MFELSDDEDEHFWNDVPLHDVSEKTLAQDTVNVRKPQLRVPESFCVDQPAKRICTGQSFTRDQVESPYSLTSSCDTEEKENGPGKVTSRRPISMTAEHLQSRKNIGITDDRQMVATKHQHEPFTTNRRSPNDNRNDPKKLDDGPVDYITPKRKRKFPGPAGVLPKLMPGQSLDIGLYVPVSEGRPKESKSPQEDVVVLSSQASENLFLDDPWQALLRDIGEDGLCMMRKFSIASTLLKAGKKQLYQGKAWLLFGVIESIEVHGSDASASIKDKSGKMHGTIHNDLMTEYEAELQVGTVLVLKQVSIISISNKNHYLNITPNNLVSMYHIKENTLKSLQFHGSQDSLHSVLKALEKESTARKCESTPDQSLSGSRLSVSGLGTSTPMFAAGTPDLQSLNKKLFNTHSPGYTSNPRLTNNSVTAVRDVSVTPKHTKHTNIDTEAKNKAINSSGGPFPNFRQQTSINTIGGRDDAANRFNNCHAPSLNRDLPQRNSVGAIKESSGDFKSNGSGTAKWRFRSPSTVSNSSSSPNTNSVNFYKMDNSNLNTGQNRGLLVNSKDLSAINDRPVDIPAVSGRSCQLQAISNIGRSERVTAAANFTNSSVTKQRNALVPSTENVVNKTSTNTKDNDLWEDDLSDEILSQLTDDLT